MLLLKEELIEELNKLPGNCMIRFGLFDNTGENVKFLELGRVDGKYIQPIRNGYVLSNPMVGYVITLVSDQHNGQ